MNETAKSGEFSDPLIDEVRAIRAAVAQRCGNDLRKLVEHLREVQRQEQHDHPIRRMPPLDEGTVRAAS